MIDLLTQHAPTIGLVFFFCFFLGVAVWLLRPQTRKNMQRYAQIPLTEDTDGRA